MITNMSEFSSDLKKLETELVGLARELGPSPERQKALRDAAAVLIKAMRTRAPVSDKIVHRYSGGRRVATYMPGNLRRSIRVLDHMRDKSAVYAGVAIQPRGGGRGIFAGNKTDGWYARFVEYGPRKRPFIRPAVMEGGPVVVSRMKVFVKEVMRKRGSN